MTADDHLRQTLAALTDHLRDSVTLEIQNVASTIGGWQDIRIAALIDARQRLRESIRSIDGARSLTGILDALTTVAGREMPRVALLIVRGGQLRTWRTIGFAGPDAVNPIHLPIDLPIAEDDAECAAVPLRVQGDVVGLLYADHGSGPVGDDTPLWSAIDALDVLVRHASRALESVTAFRTAQLVARLPHGMAMTRTKAAVRNTP